ncbi:heme o synthase [Halobacteriovorax sp. JY17]|uniref:heme o synthase n=1 Tax=Halobacteriovorax sp. JY17 TaxID=2014617 RepID=UPI000C507266|nr:heme o synthase [Halobacteriovorax sp. JY17]PIK14559.1 MAG: protoheme IX farnesyltransferase [Halobacteriovorax sp. JY17]
MHFLINLTIFLTYLLIILGGVVHNTGSGLSCPDWPLCYGKIISTASSQGAFLEQLHRFLASAIGFLTLVIFWMGRAHKESYSKFYKYTFGCFFLVLLQGGLGASTFFYKLPTLISTTHLCISLVFLCSLLSMRSEFRSSMQKRGLSIDSKSFKNLFDPTLKDGVFFSLLAVSVQIFLGAVLRHSGAGKICGAGEFFLQCVHHQSHEILYWSSIPKVQLNLAHKYFAIVSLVTVVWNCSRVFFSGHKWEGVSNKFKNSLKAHSVLITTVILIQAFSGSLVAKSSVSVIPTTVHLAIGTLLICLLWNFRNKLKYTELEALGENQHTFVSDVLEITKLRLGTLVVVTIVVGIFAAPGELNFFKAIFSLILMTMVVCGATTLNCYIERDVDKLMDRTKNRALPSGRMKPSTSLIIGYGMIVIALPLIAIFVNWPTMILSLLAAVLYLFAYTPMKLKSELALFVGAIPGAIPPVMGWTTVTGKIDAMAIILFSILFVWQIPHFLAIAIYYSKDYDAGHIKVYPNKTGFDKSKRDIFIYTIVLVLTSLTPYLIGYASVGYLNTSLVLGALFIILSILGFFKDTELKTDRWARQYFLASIIYLPILLSSLIFFS